MQGPILDTQSPFFRLPFHGNGADGPRSIPFHYIIIVSSICHKCYGEATVYQPRRLQAL